MGKRHPNWRLIKSHRTYTAEDAAQTLGVHKNTVRSWQRAGLRMVDSKRPHLFRGATISSFLRERRAKTKRPLLPGQIYCLPCHAPKSPALNMADYVPMNATTGNLRGFCPDCERLMYRRVGLAKLASICGSLDVAIAEAGLRIGETA
jgi:hypothetical protein